MASPAPALDRGIEILEWLQNKEGANLEDLAANLKIPKSSALRFLTTLEQRGIVSRDPQNKSYRCRKVLVPLYQDTEEQIFQIRRALENLCLKSKRTAEYYRPEPGGARMVERLDPSNQEVRILAGVGFFRDWTPELESVAVINLAYAPAPQLTHRALYYPGREGPKTPLSLTQAQARIAKAKKMEILSDQYFNNFGVRRMACPVFREEKLVGILALAEHFIPARKPTWSACQSLLKKEARQLFQKLNSTR